MGAVRFIAMLFVLLTPLAAGALPLRLNACGVYKLAGHYICADPQAMAVDAAACRLVILKDTMQQFSVRVLDRRGDLALYNGRVLQAQFAWKGPMLPGKDTLVEFMASKVNLTTAQLAAKVPLQLTEKKPCEQ